ncbi:MAG: hypothetical protein A2W25_00900 [candidate division Zixibacteria bacterium RBG_16_53_22]|nr:MAG: hypothetical protein A2W25_00900 [candidate division Zixibacteria bacterium RBG_16_53_22]
MPPPAVGRGNGAGSDEIQAAEFWIIEDDSKSRPNAGAIWPERAGKPGAEVTLPTPVLAVPPGLWEPG